MALFGKVLDHEDKLDYILQGLPDEYKPVIEQAEGRDLPPSLTELQEKLINFEAKLLTSASLAAAPISANYVNSARPEETQQTSTAKLVQHAKTTNTKTGTMFKTTVSKGLSGHTSDVVRYVEFKDTQPSGAISYNSTSRTPSRLCFLCLSTYLHHISRDPTLQQCISRGFLTRVRRITSRPT